MSPMIWRVYAVLVAATETNKKNEYTIIIIIVILFGKLYLIIQRGIVEHAEVFDN